jgi:CheY-like chemotaxis protein
MDQTARFRQLAASKNIQVNFHPWSEPLFEWIDVAKMEKIIENLLSNAIKYTHDGGMVNLWVQAGPKTWSIVSQDTGIGIPKKSQAQLFKAFFRGENAINSQVIGTGIGLLLTKQYVEIHKGKIDFQSEENQGSTFKLVFKQGRKHFPASATFLEESSAADKGHDFTLMAEDPVDPTASKETKKSKILIVEDNEELRNFLKLSLQQSYSVVAAENGEAALAILKKSHPEIIITDIRMPLMDGIALSRHLKQDLQTSHIPILILSALHEKEALFSAFDAQVDDYITKPFDITILKFKIKNLLLSRQIFKKRILALAYNQIEPNLIANQQDQQFVEKVIALVHTNIADSSFSVARFASGIGVSKTVLYEKLNALVGQTPNDFVKTLRIKHAMKLFNENAYSSVAEVATLSGFDDPRYFSTCFKAFYGRSPSSFLRKH